MTIQKDPHSRFLLSNPVIHNNVETFGLMAKHFFLDPKNLRDDQINSFEVTPEFAGKPWAIADKLYNSPVLDWVIVLFNKPINPVNWPVVGTVIKVPVEDVVIPNV